MKNMHDVTIEFPVHFTRGTAGRKQVNVGVEPAAPVTSCNTILDSTMKTTAAPKCSMPLSKAQNIRTMNQRLTIIPTSVRRSTTPRFLAFISRYRETMALSPWRDVSDRPARVIWPPERAAVSQKAAWE